MREFLRQIQAALVFRAYYLALAGALMVPDMAAAMDADSGTSNRHRYAAWFDKYVALKYGDRFTGAECYQFRCSMLHQGRTHQSGARYKRIMFLEPHTTSNMVTVTGGGVIHDALWIDLPEFCVNVAAGVDEWLRQVEGTEKFERNYSMFVRRYPNGLAPYSVGAPIIS